MRRQRAGFLDIDEDCIKDGYSKEDRKARSSIHTISSLAGFFLIIFLLFEFVAVYYLDSKLPEPMMISDEANNPEAFIAERAQNMLASLTDLGPRITGSYENEVLAVNLIKRKVEYIQKHANRVHDIELDQQVVSGSYFLNFKPLGFINVYKNVQNVIVKINGVNSNASVVINAHYDTVPGSPGASDDGIMCAVMLEIIEKLSKQAERPQHNLIFLFNGAEETILQASHGFITQHKWAKGAKIIINLEAGGSGGKEILFQTGPAVPWLLDPYACAPHPYGQVAGEELFQNDFVPSDTDFRIFRDFGDLVGYDFAYTNDGYRYHNKFDDIKYIPLGSYQHAGDNILSLVKCVGNSPKLENPQSSGPGNVVYYDILGFFMVYYSYNVSLVINICVSVFSIIMAAIAFKDFGQGYSWRTVRLVFSTYTAVSFGWILSAVFTYVTIIFLDSVHRTMSWYTNKWIIFGLYCAPALAISNSVLCLIKQQKNISISIQVQLQIHLIRILWTSLLIVGIVFQVRSIYAVMIPVLCNAIFFLFLKVTKMQYSVRKWQVLYVISTMIPTLMLMYQSIVITTLIVPLTARGGSDKNPEIIVGALSSVLTLFIFSFYAPLITLLRKPFYIIGTFFFVFALTLICIFTPIGFPYSGNEDFPTPQRFAAYHSSRTFKNEFGNIIKQDSGIFLLNYDRNSPRSVINYVPEFENATSVAEDCEKYLFCGLPMAAPRLLSSLDESTWIPFEKPITVDPTSLELVAKTKLSETITRLNFTIQGPDHSAVYMRAKQGATIVQTTYTDISTEGLFYIHYISGKEKEALELYVDVRVPAGWNQALIDIVVVGKNVHGKLDQMNKSFVRFYKSFPSWAVVDVAVASYDAFMF